MSHDAFNERGKALENSFFRERDRELLNKLREEFSTSGQRSSLIAATGIKDAAVLDDLLSHKITAENLTAVSIIPLIAVAWADDKMEAAEIEAVLKATHESGIEEGTSAHLIVQSWLSDKPESDLLDCWKEYIGSLKSILEESSFSQLKKHVIDRARDVAASAGGFLGMGSKISGVEQKVLDELESVFS